MIYCPYCDESVEDHVTDYSDWLYSNSLYEEGEQEVDCPNCEKKFTIESSITFKYDARPLEEEEEGYDL